MVKARLSFLKVRVRIPESIQWTSTKYGEVDIFRVWLLIINIGQDWTHMIMLLMPGLSSMNSFN